MKRPEQELQITCAQFLDLALPNNAVYWHHPAGGKRTKAEAGIFKAMGVKPGIPDILILYDGQTFGVELKAKGEHLSPAQKAMHQRFSLAGSRVKTCTSLDELAYFLAEHIPLRVTVATSKPAD